MTNANQCVAPAIQYKVVVNHEEQYSLWIDGRDNAPGWRDAGCQGDKAACLAFVRQQWTDMRPLSLRTARQHEWPAAASDSKEIENDLEMI